MFLYLPLFPRRGNNSRARSDGHKRWERPRWTPQTHWKFGGLEGCFPPLPSATRRELSRLSAGRWTWSSRWRALRAGPGGPQHQAWPVWQVAAGRADRPSRSPTACSKAQLLRRPAASPFFSSCQAPGTLLRGWEGRETEARRRRPTTRRGGHHRTAGHGRYKRLPSRI